MKDGLRMGGLVADTKNWQGGARKPPLFEVLQSLYLNNE